MRRRQHLGARASTLVGLSASAAYLVWRAAFSLGGTQRWLSVPVLLIEVFGFVASALLAWALWPHRQRLADDLVATASTIDGVDAVVRVDRQPEHEVRATLLALRLVRHVDHVVVLDLSNRAAIASLAVEFQAVHAPVPEHDANGLSVAVAAVRTAELLLLDAGDVPTIDIVERLGAELADSRTAIVQGLGTTFAEELSERSLDRRHELLFERTALNPALGRRGGAMWSGSGSLVRVAALRDVTIGSTPSLEQQWHLSAALMAAGWSISALAGPVVVAHGREDDAHAVHDDRVHRVRAARRLVFGRRGMLRSRGATMRQRLSVLAWCVRPLSGLLRIAFIAALCASLLSGAAPFHASVVVLLAGWLPAMLYTSLGLSLMSGWSLRPGDRARFSLHLIGPSGSSYGECARGRQTLHNPIVALPAAEHGAGLVVAVVVLSIVLALRGLSEQVTHALGAMPQPVLMGLLLVSLWVLLLSLDLLRVLTRRGQKRRMPRVLSSLSASMASREVTVIDLTPLGAGVLSNALLEAGRHVDLETSIPTRSGVTSIRVPCIVRGSTPIGAGEWRIGIEYIETDSATANALAEYCTIEPMWERLGVMPGRSVTEVRPIEYVDQIDSGSRAARTAVRMVALSAVAGSVAASLAKEAEAAPVRGFAIEPLRESARQVGSTVSPNAALSVAVLVVAAFVALGILIGSVRRQRTP